MYMYMYLELDPLHITCNKLNPISCLQLQFWHQYLEIYCTLYVYLSLCVLEEDQS